MFYRDKYFLTEMLPLCIHWKLMEYIYFLIFFWAHFNKILTKMLTNNNKMYNLGKQNILSLSHLIKCLADRDEARGYSTNNVVITLLILLLHIHFWGLQAKANWGCASTHKLDGEVPLITDPPPSSFTPLKKKKKQKCDMWHVTCDIWHVTRDMWHMTCDRWGEVNLLSF